MRHDVIPYKIMRAFYLYVIDVLIAAVLDGDDFVPENIAPYVIARLATEDSIRSNL